MHVIERTQDQSCFLCTCHQIGFSYITKAIPSDMDSTKMCLVCHTKDTENCSEYIPHYNLSGSMEVIYPLLLSL